MMDYSIFCIRKEVCEVCLKKEKIRKINIKYMILNNMFRERIEKEQAKKRTELRRLREIEEEYKLEKRYQELKKIYLNYNPIIKRVPIYVKHCSNCKLFQRCYRCKKEGIMYKEVKEEKHDYYEYKILKERFETCKIVEDL